MKTKTVLITGCSSGYGLETARHFHAQGWNVVATMRTPREGVLPRSERLRVLALEVTRPRAQDADPRSEDVETRARSEKVAMLEQAFRSRLSVLIGRAGTAKTTVVRALLDVFRSHARLPIA